ncbi:sensor histidine kinase [Bacillus sp. AK031]
MIGFYEEFKKRNIEPDIDIPEDDMMLLLDSSAAKRVIENLVVNAIRYSTGDVAIRLKKMDTAIQLTISNSVEKLSEQDVKQMFDRFYKADQTGTGKGTGLGLPIAKSLVEKMNGSLVAELKGNQLCMICEWQLDIN